MRGENSLHAPASAFMHDNDNDDNDGDVDDDMIAVDEGTSVNVVKHNG